VVTTADSALRIAVLVKQIPQVEELELGPDGRLRRDAATLEMNAYCRRAVAKGVELAHVSAGRCTVLTLGPRQAEQILLEAIAWGADDAVHICDPALAGSDTLATARALERALTITGPFDLVLVGRNSLDADTGQVGPAVAELLGLPFLSAVRQLNRAGGSVRVRCETDDGWLVADVQLPAVLSCAERLCDPAKAPGATWTEEFRSRLRVWTAADLGTGPWGASGSPTTVGEVRLLASTRRSRRLSGPVAAQVRAAVELLRETDVRRVKPTPVHEVPADRTAVVIVEPHRPRIARELLGVARRLARSVVAVCFEPADAAMAMRSGATSSVVVRGTTLPGDLATSVGDWCVREEPWAVLAPSTLWGRELSARVAARLGAGLVGDAVDLEEVDGRLVAWKPACAGRLLAAIRSTSPTQMVTVRPGVFAVPGAGGSDANRTPGAMTEIAAQVSDRVRVVEAGRDDDLDALASATNVVAVGKGVQPADYHELDELVDLLGAEMAATRRVTDLGWLPHSRQVGITGRSISPDLYLAVGVSGKANHMLGVRGAGVIVAINSDGDAPIFEAADVGIVADWHEVVPLLTAQLRRREQESGAELDDRVDLDARPSGQR
jgi:electron transfer flavoprotein alpha subunit